MTLAVFVVALALFIGIRIGQWLGGVQARGVELQRANVALGRVR